ncbi:MAG: hypothetical protein Q9180_009613, partial [Flavoplaca navasiana]
MENSSDLEFEPLETDPRSTRAGRLSILSLQTTATADRAKSKRAVKVVPFARGAPGTQSQQNLWKN